MSEETGQMTDETIETEAVETEVIETEAIDTEDSKNAMTPEGEALYEVDVQIDASALYDYFLRHIYNSFSGMLGTFVGIVMVMLYIMKDANVLYLIFGIVVILYLPVSLYLTARTQAMQASFQTPLHYAFYENGVEVSQGETKQMQAWENMFKAVSTSKSIILYTGKNAASIFPRRDLGEDAYALIQVISTHMDPKKVKIKE